MHSTHPAVASNLKVQVTHRLLVSQDGIIVLFVLIFVELGRVECARQPLGSSRGSSGWHSFSIRDLEIAVGQAAHKTNPAGVIQNVREVSNVLYWSVMSWMGFQLEVGFSIPILLWV